MIYFLKNAGEKCQRLLSPPPLSLLGTDCHVCPQTDKNQAGFVPKANVFVIKNVSGKKRIRI